VNTLHQAAGWMRGAVEQLMGSRVQQPRTERMKNRLLMRAGGAHARCNAELRVKVLRCQKAHASF